MPEKVYIRFPLSIGGVTPVVCQLKIFLQIFSEKARYLVRAVNVQMHSAVIGILKPVEPNVIFFIKIVIDKFKIVGFCIFGNGGVL